MNLYRGLTRYVENGQGARGFFPAAARASPLEHAQVDEATCAAAVKSIDEPLVIIYTSYPSRLSSGSIEAKTASISSSQSTTCCR